MYWNSNSHFLQEFNYAVIALQSCEEAPKAVCWFFQGGILYI